MNSLRNETIKIMLDTLTKTEFHVNQGLRLFFVVSGHLEILKSSENILLQAGDIYLVNHREIIGLTAPAENLVVVLTLPNDFFESRQESVKLTRPISPEYFTETYHQIVKQLISLLLEISKQREGYVYLAEGHHQQITGLIIRELPRVKDHQLTKYNGGINEKVTEVINFINTHYSEELPLDYIAEQFFMNKYYLSHLFKEETGITVGNYLKEVRMLNSLYMLENTEKSLTEIALANGFPSQRSFSHVFRERQGETPTEYLAKQRTTNKKINYVAKDEDIQQLLEQYLSASEVMRLTTVNHEILTEKIELNHLQRTVVKSDILLKIKPDNLWRYLPKASKDLGVRYVSVTKVVAKLLGTSEQLDFSRIQLELEQIIQQKMTPYIQFNVQDYDDFVQSGYHTLLSFEELLQGFIRFVENNYEGSQDWFAEFRCFYELSSGGELCEPLRNCLPYFKDRLKLVIHFPIHPYEVVDSEATNGQSMVHVINDTVVVKELSYELAVENLAAVKFIETIDKQANLNLQLVILNQINEVEQDGYYRNYQSLIKANQTLSMLLEFMSMRQQLLLPVSLDGSSMFQYFPAELSEKFALLDQRGVMKDIWHIYRFIYLLYEEVVFQNHYCVVTKKRDNYRLIILRIQENEMSKLVDARFDEDISINQQVSISPSLLTLKYTLQGLTGRYRIEKYELSVEAKMKQKELVNFPEDVHLSVEDVSYLNTMLAPTRMIETIRLAGDYLLELNLTPFSIYFIDFKKLSD